MIAEKRKLFFFLFFFYLFFSSVSSSVPCLEVGDVTCCSSDSQAGSWKSCLQSLINNQLKCCCLGFLQGSSVMLP